MGKASEPRQGLWAGRVWEGQAEGEGPSTTNSLKQKGKHAPSVSPTGVLTCITHSMLS